MATSGLYGNTVTGQVAVSSGIETSGLYGNNGNFGGTYFEWFIFQEAATQPATPTGGSWSFVTNVGTPPTGWTLQPPVAPTNEVWVSIALVNSRSNAALSWSTPGLFGTIPYFTFGAVITGAPGTNASLVNTGNAINPNLIFTIPRGDVGATGATGATGPQGPTGNAATIVVGTTTTGAAGTSASVTNSGTTSAAVFNFTIPRGDTGATGATGTAATIAVGTTTTGAPGTSASVTNSGSSSAAVFNFTIPRGAGVVAGGTTGQVLAKASSTDYDTSWINVVGGLNYQGNWNASANSPTLTSSVGTNGYYYTVSVAGSTNLNGVTDWQVGDWAIFNGSVWQKIDQTNSVTSVNAQTGAVVLGYADVGAFPATPTSGANSVVLRDANQNISVNSISEGYVNVAAAGTTTVLTAASAPNYVVTGSGGQTYQLPNATTLPNGVNFTFNNNQSSGAITVNNNSGTLIVSVPSGAFVDVSLLSNAIAAGSWDTHFQAPSNVSWSTNTFSYGGSITNATWNGNAIAINRGGTNGTALPTAGTIAYGTGTAYGFTGAGTSGQVLTSAGTGTPTWSTPTTGTVTSVAATAGTGISVTGSPITSSGTLNITNTAPDQTVVLTAGTGISTAGTYPSFTITNSLPDRTVVLTGAGTTSVSGTYPNFTISSSDTYTGTVTSVATAGTVNGITLTGGPITSSGTITLGGTLDLSSPPAIGGTTPAAGTFTTLTGNSTSQFGRASANYQQAVGAATGLAPVHSVLGSDANISQVFQTKGTGAIDLAAGSSGVNISNGGTVTAVTVTAGGSYIVVPTITISAPTTAGGVQATGSVTMQITSSSTIASAGSGYAIGDTITLVGGTFSVVATLTVATLSGSGVATFTVATSGTYTALPTNPISTTSSGAGTGFTLTGNWTVKTTGVVGTAGSGYVEQPTVTFSSGSAAAYASVGSGTIIRALGSTGLQSLDFYTPSGINTGIPNFRIRDTAGDSYWTSSNQLGSAILQSSNSGMFIANSTGVLDFKTGGGNQYNQLRVSNTTSAVNYVQVTGAATGSSPQISAQGSDTTASLIYIAKGALDHRFATNTSATNVQFRVVHTAGTIVNYTTATGNIAGASPSFAVAGTDTNIDLTLTPKNTGVTRAGGSALSAENGLILNKTTVATNATVATGYNALSIGPVTLSSGVTITVNSGQRYIVI